MKINIFKKSNAMASYKKDLTYKENDIKVYIEALKKDINGRDDLNTLAYKDIKELEKNLRDTRESLEILNKYKV